jgi:hypothetical protein
MKKIAGIAVLAILFACNNAKKADPIADAKNTSTVPTTDEKTNVASAGNVFVSVEGKDLTLNGSLLVTKDKDKLQAGADYLVVMTASGGGAHESITLNFLMALKEGSYPVVGTSFLRGDGDSSQVFGGILGGKPKITPYKVTITEAKDLGSNNLGGHKWSISGSFDPMTIEAMGIMMMDPSKNHPKEVKLDKVSFSNLKFDDNWEQMMEKAMEQLKKN